jgi:hypothetical protein
MIDPHVHKELPTGTTAQLRFSGSAMADERLPAEPGAPSPQQRIDRCWAEDLSHLAALTMKHKHFP